MPATPVLSNGGTGRVALQDFQPMYSATHDAPASAYYTLRREPRLLSPKQVQQGPRSSYVGDEVYLSLVDPRHAPYREDLRQLDAAMKNGMGVMLDDLLAAAYALLVFAIGQRLLV